MIQRAFVISVLLLTACGQESVPTESLVDEVNVFVGTGGLGFGVGSMTPAATAPFGMMKVGPDTTDDFGALAFSHCAGYYYDDPYIQAFSHTRLPGIGVADGGAVGFMPAAEATMDRDRLRAPLDHDEEEASPGFYAVNLDGLARVELSATPRAAHHSYRWETDGERWLNIDLGHAGSTDHDVYESAIEVDVEAGEVTGYVLMDGQLTGRNDAGAPTWFVARFDADFEDAVVWREREAVDGAAAEGVQTGASLRFAGDVQVAVGISPVDLQGARSNLAAELPDWDAGGARDRTRADWERMMGTVRVAGGSDEERAIFASALYHALQMPTLYTDVDRRYRGLDNEVHAAADWDYHTDFSLWDTYRTFHPLTILVWPDKAADFARSLSAMGEQIGRLPRWPAGVTDSGSMLGNSADVVLGESFIKGVRDFPVESAFNMALRQATLPVATGGREQLSDYMGRGFVPYDVSDGGTAKTLEYAINDHALGLWASELGETSVAAALLWRSHNYRNVFDTETNFMRGRNSDGSWAPLEDEGWGDAFAEGNAWQYSWLAPHDPQGLAELYGGEEAMVDKLQEMFELSSEEEDSFLPDPFYWHGNEPDLHASFLFAEVGRPDLTQKWVKWVREAKYSDTPEGLDGNDDGGTLSSWYVFAAMGLYPLNGTDRYVLTTPVFDQVVLQRPDGALRIDTVGEGDYLAGAAIDGVPLESASVHHSQLVGGRWLLLYRSEEPTDWGR